jgi:hypothetical protein
MLRRTDEAPGIYRGVDRRHCSLSYLSPHHFPHIPKPNFTSAIMNTDTDDIIRPGNHRTRNGSQFVLVTIDEDPVYPGDEKRTKEDGSTEVPLTSIFFGSYMDSRTIDNSKWNRKMIKALVPIHWNEDEHRIEKLTDDIRAATKKRSEDPHSEHFWKLVDIPTFDAYTNEGDKHMEENRKFKVRSMYHVEVPLADDGDGMDTSETPNPAPDDGSTKNVMSRRWIWVLEDKAKSQHDEDVSSDMYTRSMYCTELKVKRVQSKSGRETLPIISMNNPRRIARLA